MADSSREDSGSTRRTSTRATFSDEAWDEAVNTWLNDYMRNSPLSQAPAEAWNHLVAGMPELRKLLEKGV